MKRQVLVINYHRIDRDGAEPLSFPEQKFAVSLENFTRQLDLIIEHKVQVVTVDDIVNGRHKDGFSIAITFDDGNTSDLEIAYPLLKARQLPATFFWLGTERPPGDWNRVAQMKQDGFQFGSHGISHKDLTELTVAEQLQELKLSKQFLEERIGSNITYFALPYGLYTNETVRLVREAGYRAACTTDVRLDSPENDFLIHRWNVKRATELAEFRDMIQNGPVLQKKIRTTQLKKLTKRIFSKKVVAKLERWLDTRSKFFN